MQNYSKKSQLIELMVMAFLFLLPGTLLIANLAHWCSPALMNFSFPPLDGFTTATITPKLRGSLWLDGKFQKTFDDWFNTSYGAKNFLVRLNNQVLFSCFRHSDMFLGQIIIGRQDFVFLSDYLSDYYHISNFNDSSEMNEVVTELAQLNEELRKRKIAIVFVITPSKAQLCSSRLPSSWQKPSLQTRYSQLVPKLSRAGIPFVDGHAISAQLAAEGEQVFVKGGVHWTKLAASKTLNAVISEINKQNGAHYSTVTAKNISVGHPDDVIEKDLELLLNLLRPDFSYSVPHAQYVATDASYKPHGKVIFDGTSFVGQLTSVANEARIFQAMRYYFYYSHTLYKFPEGKEESPVDTEKIDWNKDILDANAIVFETNEALSPQHIHNFARDLLLHLRTHTSN